DSARKSGSKPELSAEAGPAASPRQVASTGSAAPVIMGSALLEPIDDEHPGAAVAVQAESSSAPVPNLDGVRDVVLTALGEAGHRMLVAMLETGEWAIDGNELAIKVAASATVIDMSLGGDAKRLATATASGAMGRAMKLKILPGGNAQAAPARQEAASNGGGRARAERDPIVRRMQEKFGAEIRTIIDQRDKK
ncbi:MAG: hypothetical protein WA628_01890, partial [Terriglobales bacterium]